MTRFLLSVVLWASVTAGLAAEPVIDGATAPRWSPCVDWTTTPPTSYSVANQDGLLVFSAQGAGCEMPWIIDLDRLEFSGDARYLVVRYRGRGLSTNPGVYFLHGEEGSPGGRPYAMADDLQSDGQWHTLGVDLLALDPIDVTHQLALKVQVDAGGSAQLEISQLWFANSLPAEARMAHQPLERAREAVTFEWATSTLLTREGWTTSPATDYTASISDKEMTFVVSGAGQGMRWLVALPAPVDLDSMPYVSVRYKASGAVAAAGYAIWLGSEGSGAGGEAVAPLLASDLKVDGVWHTVSVKLDKAFSATHLAVGLDSAGQQARLTFGSIGFSAGPPRWDLAGLLPHETRAAAWPPGQDGFTTEPVSVRGGTSAPLIGRRLALNNWFTAPHISVGGVPFTVPLDPVEVLQTSTAQCGELALGIAPGVRELYLLTAAAAPATEPWGIDWTHPRPVELLDVPEKVCIEIRYESGPPDRVLPLDAATGQWGMRRGLGVTVVHPDPQRVAVELVVCDRMQTAGFAIVAATTRREAPRVAEPNWEHLTYGPPPASPLASPPALPALPALPASPADAICSGLLQARFDTSSGLPCPQLAIAGRPAALACAAAPVFEVRIGGRPVAAPDWSIETITSLDRGMRFTLRHAPAGLQATVDCVPGALHELLLRMSLTNESDQRVTATLQFPVLNGLCLDSAADTWYLSGRRGGVINFVDVAWSDPLGERHPLQMDGFFNPRTGIALGLLTHDTAAQHHFIHLSKDGGGGAWSIEYPDRDLAPGATFHATEAAVVVREGDWRAIFQAYCEWLSRWFRPVAPRKPWFERTFALVSGNAHYDASPDPQTRGNVQRLVDTMHQHIGPCDYVHLFGWGASQQYGDWGDYDHYAEVGGLDYFRHNIQQVQQQGPAVSLYLDGYLNSARGQRSGMHAEAWAMKRTDGSPQFVEAYQAYNECPYQAGWRRHLSETYGRVQRELGPKIMYIDEIGATDGRWTCWAHDHGHSAHEIPYAGEVALLRDIRAAVGPDIVLYTEYPPAEASRQYLDGSITYQALWSVDQEPLAPHFIDLPRFAFPDFKQLHIIYYVTTRAGNWWLLKFPFFNGEVYRNGEPNLPGMDPPSLAFLKRAVTLQCAHREAFASHDVAPLVDTQIAGVFANRFAAPAETVWTLYNANGRSVRAPVLRVPHVEGAVYADVWNGRTLEPRIEGGLAELAVELDPKGIGCVVQQRP